jgi:signal transduction histidine kinase
MKNKIAIKLTMYFSIVLLLFSVIIGSIFIMLFRSHTIEFYKADLEKRAVTIATTLSEFMGDNSMGMGGGTHGGYGAYIRFLDDIAMTDVWIVDENLELLTSGQMGGQIYAYSDLPQDAEIVVKEAFNGGITFSEGFSNILDKPTLTVGTPIQFEGRVIGVLLLHSPVEGMTNATVQGIGILAIAILVALTLSILLSIILAISFTQPLKKMKNFALQLAAGDYSVKINMVQKDEIGELASAMDILSSRLDQASRESEHLLQLRRDFVANVSHELRTPVTVIRGSLEALCDQVVTNPEQVKRYHHQMLRESIFLQRLVDDLLDLSRLQNTDFDIEMKEINICEVLIDVIRTGQYMAKEKNIEIRQELDRQMCTIQGDYSRLRQMFLIILDNAIKFSYNKGIIMVSLKDEKIVIKDRGIGISQDNIPYIFDRFHKVKSEENRNGTGLGLAIAKQIADRHNIKLSVRSSVHEGTEFSCVFGGEAASLAD